MRKWNRKAWSLQWKPKVHLHRLRRHMRISIRLVICSLPMFHLIQHILSTEQWIRWLCRLVLMVIHHIYTIPLKCMPRYRGIMPLKIYRDLQVVRPLKLWICCTTKLVSITLLHIRYMSCKSALLNRQHLRCQQQLHHPLQQQTDNRRRWVHRS